MFNVKDKKLMPYKLILFSALGLYIFMASRRAKELGHAPEGFKFNFDTEKASASVMPWIPGKPEYKPAIQRGIKASLDQFMRVFK